MDGFFKFIKEQGIFGLAIGFILGASVSDVVNSLVQDIIQPTINLLVGSPDGIANLSYESIAYGEFLVAFIDFVILAFIVYFGAKIISPKKNLKPKIKLKRTT